MARRMVARFFIMGDLKLDNIDHFTRAVENLYVTMDACKVWLPWYLHGATYGYHGNIYEALCGYVFTKLYSIFFVNIWKFK